jgi:hypothetical protein
MSMKRLVLLAALAVLSGCIGQRLGPSAPTAASRPTAPAATESGAQRVDVIGIELPPQIGSFAFTGREVSGSTRLGDTFRYESGAATAELQIYDGARRDIGTGPESVSVFQEFERSRLRVLAGWNARPGAGAIRELKAEPFKPPAGPEFRQVEYRGLISARNFDSRLLLTGYRGQFVKLTLFLPTEVMETRGAEIDEFVNQLAALLVSS